MALKRQAAVKHITVFVYGTLKPGEVNYERYCTRAISQQPAIAYGALYDLPAGYPAMVAATEMRRATVVQGCQLQFDDPACLEALDWLEDYCPHRPPAENEYYRCQWPIFKPSGQSMGLAWVYLMELWRVQQMGGRRLDQGFWSGQTST